MPCGRFGANAAWFRLNVLTYNVLSAFKRLTLPDRLYLVRHRLQPGREARFVSLGHGLGQGPSEKCAHAKPVVPRSYAYQTIWGFRITLIFAIYSCLIASVCHALGKDRYANSTHDAHQFAPV